MKKIILLFAGIFSLIGCESKEEEARRQEERRRTTFTTTIYNYTKFDLFNVMYKVASIPFDVETAVNGGSVFFRNSDKVSMDNGQEVAGGGDTCCLIWSEATDRPLKIRVIWSVVYDLDYFDGKLGDKRDTRSFKGRGGGSTWCEAIVDVQPANSNVKADKVVLHFLADGTIKAELATFQSQKPLPYTYVKRHAVPLPEGQFCKNEIDNPLYGIPRTPHRE